MDRYRVYIYYKLGGEDAVYSVDWGQTIPTRETVDYLCKSIIRSDCMEHDIVFDTYSIVKIIEKMVAVEWQVPLD